MKQYISILVFFFFSSLLFSQNSKDEINILMNQWHKNVAESNFDDYFNKMSSDGVFIGTDALENWTIPEFKEFSKPYFDKKQTWDFKTLERNIYVDENNKFAWFDELLDTWMGICRGSGVLEKENEVWKIKHYVLSITIPNDDIKIVIEAKKEHETIQINQLKNN